MKAIDKNLLYEISVDYLTKQAFFIGKANIKKLFCAG